MMAYCVNYEELLASDGDSNREWTCPSCDTALDAYPDYMDDQPAFLVCPSCGGYWIDTVSMLRWLSDLNMGNTELFPGSDPNAPPKDNFCSMLGGDDPDSGRHLSVDKLLRYIGDILEE